MTAEELLRELAAIAAGAGPAATPAAHRELLRSIADAARALLGAEACSLALLDGEELVFEVVSGGAEADIVGMRIPATQGIAGWALSSGQPVAVEDVARDPRFASEVAESVGYTPTAILAMPLETEREVLGVIEVLDPGQRTLGTDAMGTLAVFARQAALAIESRQAFADLAGVLFRALEAGTTSEGLTAALREAGEGAPAHAELARIGATLGELGRLGPTERETARRLVEEFLAYVRARR